jgi:hypothetical protein
MLKRFLSIGLCVALGLSVATAPIRGEVTGSGNTWGYACNNTVNCPANWTCPYVLDGQQFNCNVTGKGTIGQCGTTYFTYWCVQSGSCAGTANVNGVQVDCTCWANGPQLPGGTALCRADQPASKLPGL